MRFDQWWFLILSAFMGWVQAMICMRFDMERAESKSATGRIAIVGILFTFAAAFIMSVGIHGAYVWGR